MIATLKNQEYSNEFVFELTIVHKLSVSYINTIALNAHHWSPITSSALHLFIDNNHRTNALFNSSNDPSIVQLFGHEIDETRNESIMKILNYIFIPILDL